jgi:PAS domain S-box-containing protein/putative nucleotidyltransferase with HDIG domain
MRTPPPTHNQIQASEDGNNSLLASIIDSSDDAIIGKDLKGIITSWNKGAENIFGYSAQEAIGQSIRLLIPPELFNDELNTLKIISQGKRVSHFETVRLCKDGRLIDVSATISPIIDANGNVIGASKIARDITESKKQKRLLIEANKALASQNEDKVKRESELLAITKRLEISLLETVTMAARIGEMRDAYTAGHEKSVGRLSEAIATELGFDQAFQDGIRIAGYLHDIGKIIVPIEILVKPSILTIKEFELVKEHVDAGYSLLNDISFPWPVANVVLEHHERLDGSGYPKGLKGDAISMGGKIMAVADVVDAMSTHRPYRPGLGLDNALTELKRGSGTIYDKTVVDACIKLIKVKGYQIT